MKKKLDCILLIDDDFATNYFHKIVIEDGDYAEKIIIKNSGDEALSYLRSPYTIESPRPNLIFLDINMPRMTGWEFLEQYDKLSPEEQAENVIVMLSTSSNPDELDRAEQNPHIKEYRSKPLSENMLEEVIKKYWLGQKMEA
jgi:CheY-like chemotaxis protein